MMLRYSLALVLFTALSLSAQPKPMPDVVCENVVPKIKKEKIEKAEKMEVVQEKEMKKSTLDVEVVKYQIPNNSLVSFPVTIRKNSLEGDE